MTEDYETESITPYDYHHKRYTSRRLYAGAAQNGASAAGIGTMRVSMDQLSVDDEAADEPFRQGQTSEKKSVSTGEAKDEIVQAASTASSQPESSERLPADDWGEFLGDDPVK